MNADIDKMRRQLTTERENLILATNLVGKLLLREKFYGASDDLREAERVAKATLERMPEHPGAILLRAELHHTMKEYERAQALIGEARARLKPGSLPERYRNQLLNRAVSLELSNWIETDRTIDDVIARLEALMAETRTYGRANKLASAYAKVGNFQKADALYASAVTAKGPVTPYLLAWVAYQRGLMWSEQANNPGRARPHLEQALEYLPRFVGASTALNKINGNSAATGGNAAR